jgi:hypothetical protein
VQGTSAQAIFPASSSQTEQKMSSGHLPTRKPTAEEIQNRVNSSWRKPGKGIGAKRTSPRNWVAMTIRMSSNPDPLL